MRDKCPKCGAAEHKNGGWICGSYVAEGGSWKGKIYTGTDCLRNQISQRTAELEQVRAELAAERERNNDFKARLWAIHNESQLSCKVNRGTDYPVGWDDAMCCIAAIVKKPITKPGEE